MPDLTDADLEAMEKRCEAVRTEAVRENSPWNPWFMGQAEILATDLPALIRELQAAREREAALLAEGRLLKKRLDTLADFAKSIGARSINEGVDTPLIAAEVERVKALEGIAQIAGQLYDEWCSEGGIRRIPLRDLLFEAVDKHRAIAALDREGEG